MKLLQGKTSSVFVKSMSATCRIVTVGSKDDGGRKHI